MSKLYIVGHIGSPLIGQAVAELHAMGHTDVEVIEPHETNKAFEPEPMLIKNFDIEPLAYTAFNEYKCGQQLRRERRKGKKK